MRQSASLYIWIQLIFVVILLSLPTSSWEDATAASPSKKVLQDTQIEALRTTLEKQDLQAARLSSEIESLKKDVRTVQKEMLSASQIRRHAENSTSWALWTLRLVGVISLVVLAASIIGTIYGINAGRTVQQDVATVRDAKQAIEEELAQVRTVSKQMGDEYEKAIAAFGRFYEGWDFSPYEQDYISKRDEYVFQDFDYRVTVGEVLGHKPSAEEYEKIAKFHQRTKAWGRALLRAEEALARNPNLPWSHYVKASSLGWLARQEVRAELREEFLRESYIHALKAVRLLEGKNDRNEWMAHFGLVRWGS